MSDASESTLATVCGVLAGGGPAMVKNIMARANLSQTATQSALDLLYLKGYVGRERVGRNGFRYSLIKHWGMSGEGVPARVIVFTPLDCAKPAFRHLRQTGRGYISLGLPQPGELVREAA